MVNEKRLDLVIRNAVLEELCRCCIVGMDGNCPDGGCAEFRHISQLPTVDAVEVVHGRWKNNKDDYPECDKCGYMPQYDPMIDDIWYSPYCPNCGDGFGWCEFLNVGMMDGGFCSHAERPEKTNITERTKDAMHKMGKAAHGG